LETGTLTCPKKSFPYLLHTRPSQNPPFPSSVSPLASLHSRRRHFNTCGNSGELSPAGTILMCPLKRPRADRPESQRFNTVPPGELLACYVAIFWWSGEPGWAWALYLSRTSNTSKTRIHTNFFFSFFLFSLFLSLSSARRSLDTQHAGEGIQLVGNTALFGRVAALRLLVVATMVTIAARDSAEQRCLQPSFV
jgi:hypothetical protein